MLRDPKTPRKAHVTVPLVLQVRTFFEDENSGLRRASMELFGHLRKLVSKKSSLFRAEVEKSMGTLLMHVQDGTPSACRVALLCCAPFLSYQPLRMLVQSQLAEGAAPTIPAFLSEACRTLDTWTIEARQEQEAWNTALLGWVSAVGDHPERRFDQQEGILGWGYPLLADGQGCLGSQCRAEEAIFYQERVPEGLRPSAEKALHQQQFRGGGSNRGEPFGPVVDGMPESKPKTQLPLRHPNEHGDLLSSTPLEEEGERSSGESPADKVNRKDVAQ
ncbi:unnamed protein product, partial [Eretmochelys imbricata]